MLLEATADPTDAGDAYVSLRVLAGIAAADAICCDALGQHAQGESHHDAIQLLQTVRPGGTELGNALGILLGFKSRAAYASQAVTAIRKRSGRQASSLVSSARERVARA